jgi:hypothetical protein
MSEGTENKPPEKTTLHDPEKAKESIKRAQAKGEWPIREEHSTAKSTYAKPTYKREAVPPQTEKQYPSKEARKLALEAVLNSTPENVKEETFPPEAKKILTEAAQRRHTMAMEGGEEKSPKLSKIKPLKEETVTPLPSPQNLESVVAKGGAEPLNRILKAEEENQEMRKQRTEEEVQERIARRQSEIPPEAKKSKTSMEEERNVRSKAGPPIPTPRPEQQPEPKEPGFFARLLGKKE